MLYLLSLGSNMGNTRQYLKNALALLQQNNVLIKAASSLYTSSPVDYEDQAQFYNMAIIVETALLPEQLLSAIKEIERQMGRIKIIEKGPRIIDIDIILYQGGEYKSEKLIVPHPQWEKRLFVLLPALDIIDNSACFSGLKHYLETLISFPDNFINQQIKRVIS